MPDDIRDQPTLPPVSSPPKGPAEEVLKREAHKAAFAAEAEAKQTISKIIDGANQPGGPHLIFATTQPDGTRALNLFIPQGPKSPSPEQVLGMLEKLGVSGTRVSDVSGGRVLELTPDGTQRVLKHQFSPTSPLAMPPTISLRPGDPVGRRNPFAPTMEAMGEVLERVPSSLEEAHRAIGPNPLSFKASVITHALGSQLHTKANQPEGKMLAWIEHEAGTGKPMLRIAPTEAMSAGEVTLLKNNLAKIGIAPASEQHGVLHFDAAATEQIQRQVLGRQRSVGQLPLGVEGARAVRADRMNEWPNVPLELNLPAPSSRLQPQPDQPSSVPVSGESPDAKVTASKALKQFESQMVPGKFRDKSGREGEVLKIAGTDQQRAELVQVLNQAGIPAVERTDSKGNRVVQVWIEDVHRQLPDLPINIHPAGSKPVKGDVPDKPQRTPADKQRDLAPEAQKAIELEAARRYGTSVAQTNPPRQKGEFASYNEAIKAVTQEYRDTPEARNKMNATYRQHQQEQASLRAAYERDLAELAKNNGAAPAPRPVAPARSTVPPEPAAQESRFDKLSEEQRKVIEERVARLEAAARKTNGNDPGSPGYDPDKGRFSEEFRQQLRENLAEKTLKDQAKQAPPVTPPAPAAKPAPTPDQREDVFGKLDPETKRRVTAELRERADQARLGGQGLSDQEIIDLKQRLAKEAYQRQPGGQPPDGSKPVVGMAAGASPSAGTASQIPASSSQPPRPPGPVIPVVLPVASPAEDKLRDPNRSPDWKDPVYREELERRHQQAVKEALEKGKPAPKHPLERDPAAEAAVAEHREKAREQAKQEAGKAAKEATRPTYVDPNPAIKIDMDDPAIQEALNAERKKLEAERATGGGRRGDRPGDAHNRDGGMTHTTVTPRREPMPDGAEAMPPRDGPRERADAARMAREATGRPPPANPTPPTSAGTRADPPAQNAGDTPAPRGTQPTHHSEAPEHHAHPDMNGSRAVKGLQQARGTIGKGMNPLSLVGNIERAKTHLENEQYVAAGANVFGATVDSVQLAGDAAQVIGKLKQAAPVAKVVGKVGRVLGPVGLVAMAAGEVPETYENVKHKVEQRLEENKFDSTDTTGDKAKKVLLTGLQIKNDVEVEVATAGGRIAADMFGVKKTVDMLKEGHSVGAALKEASVAGLVTNAAGWWEETSKVENSFQPKLPEKSLSGSQSSEEIVKNYKHLNATVERMLGKYKPAERIISEEDVKDPNKLGTALNRRLEALETQVQETESRFSRYKRWSPELFGGASSDELERNQDRVNNLRDEIRIVNAARVELYRDRGAAQELREANQREERLTIVNEFMARAPEKGSATEKTQELYRDYMRAMQSGDTVRRDAVVQSIQDSQVSFTVTDGSKRTLKDDFALYRDSLDRIAQASPPLAPRDVAQAETAPPAPQTRRPETVQAPVVPAETAAKAQEKQPTPPAAPPLAETTVAAAPPPAAKKPAPAAPEAQAPAPQTANKEHASADAVKEAAAQLAALQKGGQATASERVVPVGDGTISRIVETVKVEGDDKTLNDLYEKMKLAGIPSEMVTRRSGEKALVIAADGLAKLGMERKDFLAESEKLAAASLVDAEKKTLVKRMAIVAAAVGSNPELAAVQKTMREFAQKHNIAIDGPASAVVSVAGKRSKDLG